MPRINLLPWREEERKTRQRDFGVAAIGALLGGIAVIMLTMLAYAQMISSQDTVKEQVQLTVPTTLSYKICTHRPSN